MTPMPKRAPSKAPGERALDADEVSLWNQVARGVTPLTKPKTATPATRVGKQDQPAPSKPRILAPEPYKSNQNALDLKHGAAPGLDKRTQLRLRRGQVKVESRIDLHGLTQVEAYRALVSFLENAYMSGRRTTLVITGKGLRADGAVGVLRAAVPRWLNEAPLRHWVRAFDYAASRDGGEGALYVLLRRRK